MDSDEAPDHAGATSTTSFHPSGEELYSKVDTCEELEDYQVSNRICSGALEKAFMHEPSRRVTYAFVEAGVVVVMHRVG